VYYNEFGYLNASRPRLQCSEWHPEKINSPNPAQVQQISQVVLLSVSQAVMLPDPQRVKTSYHQMDYQLESVVVGWQSRSLLNLAAPRGKKTGK
jgi:hypothetical protein